MPRVFVPPAGNRVWYFWGMALNVTNQKCECFLPPNWLKFKTDPKSTILSIDFMYDLKAKEPAAGENFGDLIAEKFLRDHLVKLNYIQLKR